MAPSLNVLQKGSSKVGKKYAMRIFLRPKMCSSAFFIWWILILLCINCLYYYCILRVSAAALEGDISHSPKAQIPAEKTSNEEVITKKLIVCPISSHEPVQRCFSHDTSCIHLRLPVSVTRKKNVNVMPKNI